MLPDGEIFLNVHFKKTHSPLKGGVCEVTEKPNKGMLITGAITMLKTLENGNELNLLQIVFEIVIGIRKKTLLKVSICVTYCVL